MSTGRWIALIETDTGAYYLQALVPSVAMEPFFLSATIAFATVVAIAAAFYYFHSTDGFDQAWDDEAKKMQDEKHGMVKKLGKDIIDKIQKQKRMLIRKCEEMKMHNDELTEQCKQLENDKRSLEEQISGQTEKLDQLTTLEKRNVILEKLVNDLRKPSSDSNVETLQSLNDELHAKNQELVKKVHNIETTTKESSTEAGDSSDAVFGGSLQEAQKLKNELTRLNGLKKKVEAEKDSIDTIKETVQKVVDSLVSDK